MSIELNEEQRRELWGIALLALALLLCLSLFPLGLLGSTGDRLFPTGNIVGVAGRSLAGGAWAIFGIPALLLPVFPALWGLVAYRRIAPAAALRWTLLLVGIVVLLPTALWIAARPLRAVPVGAGWLGAALGAPSIAWFGWVGASLLLLVLFAALCVATLSWNPMRSAAGGGAAVWSGTRHWAYAVRPRLRFPTRRGESLSPDESGWEGDETLSDEPMDGEPADSWTEQAPEPEEGARKSPLVTLRPRVSRRKAAVEDPHPLEDSGDPEATDLPTTALLAPPPARNELRNRQELEGLGQALVDKLATFRIEGRIVGMTSGPVVTQFEVEPAPGVKVSRIASLESDLALAMRAASIRIIAPIPGKGAVGVEVPNPAAEMVSFREAIESHQFRNSRAQLPLALGKDIAGRPYVADLAKMPHLLIAGATGSGKSVCVNTIITSLIYRHSPQTLRLLMVDPKMVELSMYNDLPHLRHPVVTDNSEAAGVLKWAVLEMERRYTLLSANGVRNLQDFNKRLGEGQMMRFPETAEDEAGEEGDPNRWIYRDGPLPYVVLIIDELADLMMTVQGDVEKPLALLAQKARAIGIHLILATQRPSVNVITGLIKANFPSRIAFRVSSKTDSRTILDQNGADALLGNGDMLFLPPGQSDPVRIQGAFISTEETEQLMAWYREQARLRREAAEGVGEAGNTTEADILEIVRAAEGDAVADEFDEALEDRDKLFRQAAELCIQHSGGSTSLLQRRLRIGYGRAARIIDQLHHAGVLGPPDGSKPREVLVDLIQLDQFFPDG